MKTAAERTAAYDLGRARGATYGRKDPTERDWEWIAERLGVGQGDTPDDEADDFLDGMLDGAEQVETARLGIQGTPPPSVEAIAAAKDAAEECPRCEGSGEEVGT